MTTPNFHWSNFLTVLKVISMVQSEKMIKFIRTWKDKCYDRNYTFDCENIGSRYSQKTLLIMLLCFQSSGVCRRRIALSEYTKIKHYPCRPRSPIFSQNTKLRLCDFLLVLWCRVTNIQYAWLGGWILWYFLLHVHVGTEVCGKNAKLLPFILLQNLLHLS